MKKFFRTMAVVFAVLFGFSLAGCSHSEKQKEPVQESKVETSKEIETPNLGMTFQEFKEKYNKQVAEHNISQLAMNEIHWEESDTQKKFFSPLNDTIRIYGEVDVRTGNLSGIVVCCEPKKTRYGKQEVEKAALVHAIAMKILNPSLTKQDLTNIGNDLGKKPKRNFVINGTFRYGIYTNDDSIFLSIESANSK